jgi:hypothetical protein
MARNVAALLMEPWTIQGDLDGAHHDEPRSIIRWRAKAAPARDILRTLARGANCSDKNEIAILAGLTET